MKVTMLGSGTCAPSVKRAGPAALLEAEGCRFLVDSSAGTMRQLVRLDIRPSDLDFIIYTHLHVDHTGDFPTMLFSMKYGGHSMSGKLPVILAAEGFRNFWNGLEAAWGEWVQLPDMRLEEFPAALPSATQHPPFIIRTAPVTHIESSLAWRIEDSKGRAVVFSGDTDISDALTELASKADLLVLECAFPDEHKVKGHLVPSEAGKLAQKAGVKQLLLTHFYPICEKHDMIGPCKAFFDGKVTAAEDFMEIEL